MPVGRLSQSEKTVLFSLKLNEHSETFLSVQPRDSLEKRLIIKPINLIISFVY